MTPIEDPSVVWYAYLDEDGNVVGFGKTERSLEELSGIGAVTKIAGAPYPLYPKDDSFSKFYHRKISGDGTQISDYTEIPNAAPRTSLYDAIDDRTCELIAEGYSYDGYQFSASRAAQVKLLTLAQDSANLQFPISLASKDDETDPYSVTDAATLFELLTALRGHIQSCIDSGDAIKAQIRAAATYDDAAAIEDTR